MPGSLCVLVSRPPYGTLEPAEAIRHARGALSKGWEVVLAFMGESVATLVPGQSPPAGEWVSLSEALADLIGEGEDRVQLLAEEEPLRALGLSLTELIPGVQAATHDDIARTLARCERVLVF